VPRKCYHHPSGGHLCVLQTRDAEPSASGLRHCHPYMRLNYAAHVQAELRHTRGHSVLLAVREAAVESRQALTRLKHEAAASRHAAARLRSQARADDVHIVILSRSRRVIRKISVCRSLMIGAPGRHGPSRQPLAHLRCIEQRTHAGCTSGAASTCLGRKLPLTRNSAPMRLPATSSKNRDCWAFGRQVL
jgi:hypothetical protein